MQELHCRMDLAVKYGADLAIFLHNLVFWVEKNRAAGRHFHDGRYWTYNTLDALAQRYPLWSRDQLKRLIARGRRQGAVLVGCYNRDRRDRTCWYAPSDEVLALYRAAAKKRPADGAEPPQSQGGSATPLPEGLPEGLLHTPPVSPGGGRRKRRGPAEGPRRVAADPEVPLW